MQTNEEFVKRLGNGAYGFVDLVRYTNHDDNTYYLAAVKNSYKKDYNTLQRELHVLLQLKGCPRIVTCLGDSLQQSVSRFGEIHKLPLEYASQGSLSAFMNRYADDKKLPEALIKDFARMILEGLVSIHSHGYVHCDIKPDNVLVFPSSSSTSYEVKICDFGNCLEKGEVPPCWEIDFPWLGTPIYSSPASVRDGIASTSLDLWSVGCLVLEMYTGVSPWEGVELDDIATRLLSGQAPEIPESLPCDARDFIQTCFSREPEERGSASELLLHPFFLPRPETSSSSFLLNLFKLRIRRRGSEKKLTTTDAVSDKKPLELLRFWKKKATQFKRNLNIVLRLKKSTDLFSLVFVHQSLARGFYS